MYFLYLTLGLISAFASLAVAEDAQIVHCGTTSDATLSDCHNLIDNVDTWNAAFNTNNICHFFAFNSNFRRRQFHARCRHWASGIGHPASGLVAPD
ncbi:hypothetical protein RQP46_004610 [Phenoliferia psychrophenolica]